LSPAEYLSRQIAHVLLVPPALRPPPAPLPVLLTLLPSSSLPAAPPAPALALLPAPPCGSWITTGSARSASADIPGLRPEPASPAALAAPRGARRTT
jgi:hypothetical protein